MVVPKKSGSFLNTINLNKKPFWEFKAFAIRRLTQDVAASLEAVMSSRPLGNAFMRNARRCGNRSWSQEDQGDGYQGGRG